MRYFRSVIVRLLFVGCAALAGGAFALAWVARQGSLARAETSVQDDAKHDALKQNFLAEHEIGRRFRIDPAGLPAPKTGPIVSNRALIVAYTGQALQVPAGFTATSFATGLVNPRRLLVLPNGDVLVAEQSAGRWRKVCEAKNDADTPASALVAYCLIMRSVDCPEARKCRAKSSPFGGRKMS
jgi:glucose/arabinose dehydrogenase